MGRISTFLRCSLIGSVGGGTTVLEGLRTVFNYFVVSEHVPSMLSVLQDYPPPASAFAAEPKVPTWTTILRIIQMVFHLGAVEVFFVISGFLLGESISISVGDNPNDRTSSKTDIDDHKVSWRAALRHMLKRWLRLLPIKAVCTLLYHLLGKSQCGHWSEFLFIPNLVRDRTHWDSSHAHDTQCMFPAWSLYVDLQAHFIILLFLVVTSSWRKTASLSVVLAFLSGIGRGVAWVSVGAPRITQKGPPLGFIDSMRGAATVREHARLFGLPRTGNLTLESFDDSTLIPDMVFRKREALAKYMSFFGQTHYRCGPLLVGFALWVAMRTASPIVMSLRRRPWAAAFLTACPFAFMMWWITRIFVLDGTETTDRELGLAGLLTTAFADGFCRLFFAIGFACVVIVLTCEIAGRQSDAVQKSLPARGFRAAFGNRLVVGLSKMSYPVYLVHPLVTGVTTMFPLYVDKDSLTDGRLLLAGVAVYIASIVVSVPLCVVEEAVQPVRKKLVDAVFPRVSVKKAD